MLAQSGAGNFTGPRVLVDGTDRQICKPRERLGVDQFSRHLRLRAQERHDTLGDALSDGGDQGLDDRLILQGGRPQ